MTCSFEASRRLLSEGVILERTKKEGTVSYMVNCLYDVSISLKIVTDKSIESVSDSIGFMPTEVFRKGSKPFRNADYTSPHNVWLLTERYPEQSDIRYAVGRFFQKFGDCAAKANRMQEAEPSIRISLVSDFAQMGFTLTDAELDFLKRSCLPIEFSVFSFGMEDDSD